MFRHLFRRTYGCELRWDRFHQLLAELAETLGQLREQLRAFLEFLGSQDTPC
jgi:hypothetical protein